MTLPDSPCGTFSEVSRTSRAFSPKIARSSRSSGVSSVSPLGVTLPTRMSPATTSAPMRMMPRSSRSARTSSETFGMSRVISSGPSLVSRASTSCSSMWIEERTSSCTRRWLQDDRVLVVVALPRHERHQQVACRAPSRPRRWHGPSASTWPTSTRSPSSTSDPLVEARCPGWSGGTWRPVGGVVPSSFGDRRRRSAETSVTTPAFVGDDDVAGVDGGAVLHAGADERRLGADQRHGLALHVGAHERAVGVVVLEERDHGGRDRHHLARRDVHVVDVVAGDVARPRRP